MLPKDIAKLVPKTHLMSESEWRNLGVQQSQGWVHYMIHEPEPHILLFRRPLPKKPKIWSWRATFQPLALHSCPHLLTSFWRHYVAFLFLTLLFKVCLKYTVWNVLVTALLLEQSQQRHYPARGVLFELQPLLSVTPETMVSSVSNRTHLADGGSIWE